MSYTSTLSVSQSLSHISKICYRINRPVPIRNIIRIFSKHLSFSNTSFSNYELSHINPITERSTAAWCYFIYTILLHTHRDARGTGSDWTSHPHTYCLHNSLRTISRKNFQFFSTVSMFQPFLRAYLTYLLSRRYYVLLLGSSFASNLVAEVSFMATLRKQLYGDGKSQEKSSG